MRRRTAGILLQQKGTTYEDNTDYHGSRIGSRFGTGIKQLAKMSDNGEIIMDYSIYDAKEAGFDKVVFVIRKDIEEEFKAVIGNRIGSQIEVEYVYQELTDLPEGFTVRKDVKNHGEQVRQYWRART